MLKDQDPAKSHRNPPGRDNATVNVGEFNIDTDF